MSAKVLAILYFPNVLLDVILGVRATMAALALLSGLLAALASLAAKLASSPLISSAAKPVCVVLGGSDSVCDAVSSINECDLGNFLAQHVL